MDISNNNNIELDLNAISKLRNENRNKAINEFSLNLYRFLKENNYKVIEKDFLLTFFSNWDNVRTRNRIFKSVIENLKQKGKITQTDKTKTHVYFRNVLLNSYDEDSYKTLMVKNGFKSYLYKWVKTQNNTPKKILLGVYDVNTCDSDNLTLRNVVIENKTRLNLNNKRFGCFSKSQKSLIKCNRNFKIKSYLVN